MIQHINAEPGAQVIKLTQVGPQESWFNQAEWRKLPPGTKLEIERIDEQPDYGGTVIQLTTVTSPGIYIIPAAWFNTQNFRVLSPLNGQQELKFQEPDYSRLHH
jgi:hypothetical protein